MCPVSTGAWSIPNSSMSNRRSRARPRRPPRTSVSRRTETGADPTFRATRSPPICGEDAMTDRYFEQNVSGSATALQADTMHVNYWTGDYVKLSRVTSSKLAYCSGDDYVHPSGESGPAEGTQVRNAAR